jgi:hypothetical protein
MNQFLRARWRLVLPLCVAMMWGWIVIAESQPRTAITNQSDAIWVYYTSICARPNDASDCVVQRDGDRPVFSDHQACASYRDRELAGAANPRLLGSCRKQNAA